MSERIELSLTLEDAHRLREWFDAVQDISPNFLDYGDLVLARRLYAALGMRVPFSIVEVSSGER